MKTVFPVASRASFRLLAGSSAMISCVLLAGSSLSLRGQDFIRGDVNGDGKVTISDAHGVLGFLFSGLQKPWCLLAADVEDTNFLNLTDGLRIASFSVLGEPMPPAPYPEPGPDPTPPSQGESLGCESYGGGQPLEDAGARLVVLDATFPGGAERGGTITIACSSSRQLAGFSGRLSHDPGLIDGVGSKGQGLTDRLGYSSRTHARYFLEARDGGAVLSFGFLAIIMPCGGDVLPPDCQWIPIPAGGGDVPVVDIQVCLAPGTPAGQYSLVLEEGELIDAESARAIYPTLQGGTLTVLSNVESSDCIVNPPPPPPPPDVVFKLADAFGAPGGSATVPFRIWSTLPSQGFAFSVDFDESVLQASDIERLFRRPSGTPYEFQRFEFNNEDRYPGDSGIAEGYLAGAAIISLADTQDVLPPDAYVDVLNFHFFILPETTADKTEVRFLDGAVGGDGAPVSNSLIASGRTVSPAAGGSFVFVNGIMRIVPDAIPFVRGDSNSDGKVDISDPIATLGNLFLGGVSLQCLDAADSNDDGQVNISDPIFTLDFLFRGISGAPPQPFPEPGLDPTGDELRC
jgi:hypothetical protein